MCSVIAIESRKTGGGDSGGERDHRRAWTHDN